MMTRTVACTHRPSRDSNRTEVLRDEDCQNPKPSPVQACNRFDCPPMWDTPDWGQCSQSCGGGVQRRQILCKQRLADGSILELPDTFCPSKSPANQQPCAKQECPPHWVTTDWSQCSVSCGNGIQTLQTILIRPTVSMCSKLFLLCTPAGECRDSTRYCEKVRQLELCPLPQFKSRCCHSCRNT
uniref:PLAC domain-containing protein n=1 Tax=Seriola lalandi dorsalis TaxID=1841481 RepID=A0A3B4WPC4_SERLL